MKKLLTVLTFVAAAFCVLGQNVPPTFIEEEDGSPSAIVGKILFPNGSITDNGDGTFSIATGASGVNNPLTDHLDITASYGITNDTSGVGISFGASDMNLWGNQVVYGDVNNDFALYNTVDDASVVFSGASSATTGPYLAMFGEDEGASLGGDVLFKYGGGTAASAAQNAASFAISRLSATDTTDNAFLLDWNGNLTLPLGFIDAANGITNNTQGVGIELGTGWNLYQAATGPIVGSYNSGATTAQGYRIEHGESKIWRHAIFGSGNSNPNAFAILEDTTARMTIEVGGNVGIGITDPTEALDVVGDIKASTGVYVGSQINSSPLAVDGSADVVQLSVQGHSTQTANVMEIENSAGTVVWSVDNAGDMTATTMNVTTLNATSLGITDGGQIEIEGGDDLIADDNWQGTEVITGILSGDIISFGEFVYFDPTVARWEKANASAEATSIGLAGFALSASTDGGSLDVLVKGILRDDSSFAWTDENQPLYISDTTAGQLTETPPSDTGDIVRVVGFSLSPDHVWVNVSPHWSEVGAASGSSYKYVMPTQTPKSGWTATDAANRYWGWWDDSTSVVSNAEGTVPVAGNIVRVDYIVDVGGTLGSSENVTHYIRLNDTTDNLSVTNPWDSANEYFSVTGSLAVVAGDRICVNTLTPTFTTDPTSVRLTAFVTIEVTP